ncbi:hypothetical protein [Burkholderia sp. TSV86]|uniref:hypothetical protein n=1 Tax=Burkholderia sp. TSV86 TaxID=1385594 RepID=UPI0018D27149
MTDDGTFDVEIPREHEGAFAPVRIAKSKRRFTDFDDRFIAAHPLESPAWDRSNESFRFQLSGFGFASIPLSALHAAAAHIRFFRFPRRGRSTHDLPDVGRGVTHDCSSPPVPLITQIASAGHHPESRQIRSKVRNTCTVSL